MPTNVTPGARKLLNNLSASPLALDQRDLQSIHAFKESAVRPGDDVLLAECTRTQDGSTWLCDAIQGGIVRSDPDKLRRFDGDATDILLAWLASLGATCVTITARIPLKKRN